MESFYNSKSPSLVIESCLFQDIIGDSYYRYIGAVVQLITKNCSGSITISDSQFINCRSYDLAISNYIGGCLYINTVGDQHFVINFKNLLFTECNSFKGAAFGIKSESPINFTEFSCRNINVTHCINLPVASYFDDPHDIIFIQNCFINQFANVLFENINNHRFLHSVLALSNCDGKISSVQFTDIIYDRTNPIIEIFQSDGYEHSFFFDGLGFRNIQNAFPILLSNYKNSFNLNVVIDNLYFPGSDIILTDGSVSCKLSYINQETDGINIITPISTVFPSPTESPFETPTESPIETPTKSPYQTPSQSNILVISSKSDAFSSDLYSETNEKSLTENLKTKINLISKTKLITEFFSSSSFDGYNESNILIRNKPNTGLIIGCSLVGVVIIIVIILVLLFIKFKRKSPILLIDKDDVDNEESIKLYFFDDDLGEGL